MKTQLRKFLKKLRGQIKQSDSLFALRRSLVDKDLRRERKNLKKYRSKSRQQIDSEMRLYKNFWKCVPHDYIRYGLFSKDLSTDEILDYIPMHYYYCDYYNQIFADITNEASREDYLPRRYPLTHKTLSLFPKPLFNAIDKGKNLSDKLLQFLMLRELRIPVPEVIGVIYANSFYNLEGESIDFSTTIHKHSDSKKLFIKPTDGCGGAGIVVLENHSGAFKKDGRNVTSLADLGLNSAQVYIVQKALAQLPELAQINPSSVNTLRTIVKYEDGIPRIIGIILRMGRKNSHVDNSAVGGFSVGIDIETGRFFDHGAPEHGGGIYDRHPDSNYIFKGNGIKNWAQIKKEIYRIISKITDYPIIGWDIAPTKNGVQAIEFNMGFGIEHAQTILGGLRRTLNINP